MEELISIQNNGPHIVNNEEKDNKNIENDAKSEGEKPGPQPDPSESDASLHVSQDQADEGPGTSQP